MSYMDESGVFCITSVDKVPNIMLVGSFFFNNDFVIDDGVYDFCEANGEDALKSVSDGRFILIHKDADSHIVRCDEYGQDLIFYFSKDTYWAFSNSLLKLAEVVIRDGHSLYFDNEALCSFRTGHPFGDSLVSDRTCVKDVSVLGVDEALEISRGKKIKKIAWYNEALSVRGGGGLFDWVEQWSERIKTIVRSPLSLKCDVTGGLDSRVVLGLVVASGCDLRDIHFVSRRDKGEDYQVATWLSGYYGFSLNKPVSASNYKKASGGLAFKRYCYSSVGVYKNPQISRFLEPVSDVVHLSGFGGGCIRPAYSGSPNDYIKRRKADYSGKDYLETKSLFLKSLEKINVDPDAPKSHAKYYKWYRSRCHFGRNSYKRYTSLIVSPVYSKVLEGVYEGVDFEGVGENGLFYGIMMCQSPELALHPYDSPRKYPSTKLLNNIHQWLARKESDGKVASKAGVVYRGQRCAVSAEGDSPGGGFSDFLINALTILPDAMRNRFFDGEEYEGLVNRVKGSADVPEKSVLKECFIPLTISSLYSCGVVFSLEK